MSAVAAIRNLSIDYETKSVLLTDAFQQPSCARIMSEARIITMEKVNETPNLDPECAAFYSDSMRLLAENSVPFLLGGAYALCVYTGVARHTKDVDLFIKAADIDRTVRIFQKSGYHAEKTFPHWLAKVYRGDNFVDLIYAAGNGLAVIDDSWFTASHRAELLGREVEVMSPADIIWMKAFIQERERYDGADIAHLIQACAETIDWERLRARFGPDWRVLLSCLVLFGYIYPSERWRVPPALMAELLDLLSHEQNERSEERICRGTLLSRAQFLPDVTDFGYRDARLEPRAAMSERDIRQWTAAIDESDRARAIESSP